MAKCCKKQSNNKQSLTVPAINPKESADKIAKIKTKENEDQIN